MNSTLDRLITAVLADQSMPTREATTEDHESISQALRMLPMPLSARQQQAIRNAWTSHLSYIQGPPGTGKSHTIAATMLCALFLGRRVLLVSHKRAAIDVVSSKLFSIMKEDLAIYVGADADRRAATRAKILGLIEEVQQYRFPSRLNELRNSEAKALRELLSALREADNTRRSLESALSRTNAAFRFHQQHLRARNDYASSFDLADVAPDALASAPEDLDNWPTVLEWFGDLAARRAEGRAVNAAELLKARSLLSKYKRAFRVEWIKNSPWDAHRLSSHFRTVHTNGLSRRESASIRVDLNALRRTLDALQSRVTEAAIAYLQRLVRRAQLEAAASCVSDLSNFAALFRLRSPRLVRAKMESIHYGNVTRVFPLWLGEMRQLGSVLPFQAEIFDLAIVDEASQVNIAEVLPAFYRASSFAVVGDRKQLGLEAAGLFAINRTFEELTWNNCFGGVAGVISYELAQKRELTVSTSSILDFVVSPSNSLAVRTSVLDEHFRSMPPLAEHTSGEFYTDEGGLKIMTEVGENLDLDCFKLLEVGGKRQSDSKVVRQEVDKAVEIVLGIVDGSLIGPNSDLRRLGFRAPDRFPTVGVISFTTDQTTSIQSAVDSRLQEADQRKIHLLVGTPEEFQGNERDVMILTFALGADQRFAKAFYEKSTRFNVATSRAKRFTFAVIGSCPANATMLRRYFGRFGFAPRIQQILEPDQPAVEPANPSGARMSWRLDERKCESEFERRLLTCLNAFIDNHSNRRLKLFNQVTTCGQKRLDFVVYDEDSGRSVAVEVDGPDHFCVDGQTYHEEHLERVSTLKRAGWRIVHVPYFKWYRHGWLADSDSLEFTKVQDDLFGSLRTALEIEAPTAR